MIKINLIGTKVKPKAKGPGAQVYIFLGLFLLEAVLIFAWYQMQASEVEEMTKKAKDAQAKVEALKKVKAEWEQWQVEKADLERQAKVFESLRAGQLGPPMLLAYLSYILTRVPDTPENADEIKAQELAGWNPKWNSERVWLRRIEEKGGIATITGEAVDHEDVAEFYRRLESSDLLTGIEPGLQSRKVSPELGIRYVEFRFTATIQYPPPDVTLGAGHAMVTK